MLRSVLIKSYRSCKDVLIDNIDELTLLVGKNGVGKSNILKSINWCAHTATATSGIQIVNRSEGDISIVVELEGYKFSYSLTAKYREVDSGREWFLKETLDINSKGAVVNFIERNGPDLMVNGSDFLVISPQLPAMSAVNSLMPLHPYSDVVSKFNEFLKKITYYPLVELENAGENYSNAFLNEDQFAQWTSSKFAENTSKMVLCKILDFYLNKKNKFEELLSLLGKDGIDLVDSIEISQYNLPKKIVNAQNASNDEDSGLTKIYFLEFHPSLSAPNSSYKFDSLSFGTKRLIRFVTDFLYDGASISLVEQPEDGVHCGLLYKLFDLLESYSEGRQSIVASHSADLLNRADPSSIRMVDILNGVTTARKLSFQEKSAADNFKRRVGSLSEFIRSLQE